MIETYIQYLQSLVLFPGGFLV